ncbi:MAG: hypothetical protein KGL39_29985 [Patescibacteria group bacterium]|nr:hypothetical protein [Patescibacteria group bacterium]
MTVAAARRIMEEGPARWRDRQVKLSVLCKRLRITQRDLAEATGLTHQQVHNRMVGEIAIAPWEMEAFCELIGLASPAELDDLEDAWHRIASPADLVRRQSRWIVVRPGGRAVA